MQDISHSAGKEVITWQAAAILFRCGIKIEVQLYPPMNWILITNPHYKFAWSAATRRYRVAEE